MRILNHVPAGVVLRPVQRDMLLAIEEAYRTADVFVVRAPTGSGKTIISVVIARWRASLGEKTAYVQPTNILAAQVKERHPEVHILNRKSSYHCEMFDRTCAETAEKCKRQCKGCPYTQAKKLTRVKPVTVQNQWIYFSHSNFEKNVIFDEGHTLLETLTNFGGVKLWQHEFNIPTDFKTVADVVAWIQAKMHVQEDKRLAAALKDILRIQDEAKLEYNWDKHRGRDALLLHVKPQSVKSIGELFWPRQKVKKLFLLSATLHPIDIADLGLEHRRVVYIDGDSPIPAANRPIFIKPVVNLSYKLLDAALPVLAKEIKIIMDQYPNKKGIVHVPYAIGQRLRPLLQDERLIYHDRETKNAALEQFKLSEPEAGKVFICSGLFEGLDLPYDAARWQIIAKTPFPSLADPGVVKRANESADWYSWQTLKKLVQAFGRIVRAADDMGDTYVLDSNVLRLINEDLRRDKKQRMIPAYVREAMKFVKP